MLCLSCGAEMSLVQVVKDTTMFVSGYEHHTWQCLGCSTVEQRMTFAREKKPSQTVPVEPFHAATVEPTQVMPVDPAQMASLEPAQTLAVAPAQELPARPNETLPAGAGHLKPPAAIIQTNAWFEKLRNLKERAAAAREAAAQSR